MKRYVLNWVLLICCVLATPVLAERETQNGQPIGVSNWPAVRRYDSPPRYWDEFRLSLRRMRQLVDNPNMPKDERDALIKAVHSDNKLIIEDKKASIDIIHYIVGSGLNDEKSKEVYDNLEYLQAQSKNQNPELVRLRPVTNFQILMGWVGQDASLNPERFRYFFYASAEEAVQSKDWKQQFHDVMHKIKVYDEKTHQKMGFYRKTGGLVHGLATVAGAVPGTVALFTHGAHSFGLGPDLQVMAGGLAGMWAGGKLRERIEAFGHARVRPQLAKEAKEIEDAYQVLLELDPERTAPHLVSNVIDGLHDPAQKALGDLSLALLKRTASKSSDKALITLGMFMIKEGNAEMTTQIFEELARRDPNGPYGKQWPKIKEYVETLKKTGQHYGTLKARNNWKKAGYAALPAVAAVWATLRTLSPEELAVAVVVARDLAIGEMATHKGEKFLSYLTRGNMSAAMAKAKAELMERLQGLTGAGGEGIEILSALAENKIPGRMGEVLANAATEVLRNYEGFSAPHVLARLDQRNNARRSNVEIVDQVDHVLNAQQRTLDKLCRLNFGKLKGRHG